MEFCTSPKEDEVNYIKVKLDEYNFKITGNDNHTPYNIVVYDDDHHIIAGLLGGSYWGWMYIDRLWVDEKYRKNGIGNKLIKLLEEEAISRECQNIYVETMSFQALGFYKKNRYKMKLCIKDFPKGHSKYLLIKTLKPIIENKKNKRHKGRAIIRIESMALPVMKSAVATLGRFHASQSPQIMRTLGVGG